MAKRKYETLYSSLWGKKKNYLDDVPMYGPKKTHLDTVPTGWSPGQFTPPQDLEAIQDRQLINKAKNAPANSADWFRYNEGELSPAVQAAIDREMARNRATPEPRRKSKLKGLHQIPEQPQQQPQPRPDGQRPDGPIAGIGRYPGPTELTIQGPPKGATTSELTFPTPQPPLKDRRQPPPVGTGGLRPIPGATAKPQPEPEDVEEEVEEEDGGVYPATSQPAPPLRSDLFGGGRPKGLDPDRFTMGPWDRPDSNIAGADPDTMSMFPDTSGPEIPEGTVTSETKEVRARIRDARDQIYTPRDILSPQPGSPSLTPKWDGASYGKINQNVPRYEDPRPPIYKLDPTHPVTPNRRIDENVDPYRKIDALPPSYNIDRGPKVGPRERVTPATMYKEVRPGVWKLVEAPSTPTYDRVHPGQRFEEPRPTDYEVPDYPDLERPERMTDPTRYEEPLPSQMDMRETPLPRDYDKVDIGEEFKRPIPEQYPIGQAPISRQKDFDYKKLGEPDSVGQMRDKVWRPNLQEADYRDIQGPDKMAPLKDVPLGKYDDLAEWDKGAPKPFVREPFIGYRNAGVSAGMADVARSIFTLGKGFQGAAGKAVGEEADRMERFNQRMDQKEIAMGQLNQAERQQRLAEQQFKYTLQRAIGEQGIQIRGQDLDYIKAGAQLSMQEFQTRLQERMGHNADKLRFNDSLINEAQNFNQADQNLQAINIEARQADRSIRATYNQLDNATVTNKINALQSEDRLDFDKWAKTQDLTQEQYGKALNAWSLEQQAKYGQQVLGVDAKKFNVQAAQKLYDQALSSWTVEESAKDSRFDNALQAHQEGRATLNDYQILQQKQQEFNSTQGQQFQQMLQQEYRDVSGVAGQKARFGLDSWQAGQTAEEQYQNRKLQAQEFNVGTDIKKFDQDLSRWDKTMGYSSQNFNDSMQRWRDGRANHQDYQVLRFHQEKQDIDEGNTKFNQNLDVWDKTLGHKDAKLRTDIDKWRAGADDHYKFLDEKRLRFGLNEKEQRDYDTLSLQKWQIEQNAKDVNFDSNLERWDKGLNLHKFMSEEERLRFAENNAALYRADANAIAKYGQDADLWEKYNKLPSDIRKDEAMADNYMNWYAQEQMKLRGEKIRSEDPLKMAQYYDNFNKDWTGSQTWKDYEEAGKSFQKIVAAPPTGFGDMAAIYGFIKTIDPKTGVKEGERDFAVSAMGWLKKAEASGALEGLPKGVVRKIQRALDGEIMLPEDRMALAKAAYEATNVTRQSYAWSLAQHIKTWKSTERLRDNTDRIMRQPDYFGETDVYGNKLSEPGWEKVMRDKYKDFKPQKRKTKPKGKPLPKPSFDDPNYDPTEDFDKALSEEEPA